MTSQKHGKVIVIASGTPCTPPAKVNNVSEQSVSVGVCVCSIQVPKSNQEPKDEQSKICAKSRALETGGKNRWKERTKEHSCTNTDFADE